MKKWLTVLCTVLVAVNTIVSVGVIYKYYHKPTPKPTAIVKVTTKPQPTPAKPTPTPTPTYKVGDTQTDDQLTVTPTKTYTMTQSQTPKDIGNSNVILGIDLTITNTGTSPVAESLNSGFQALSILYTQVGNDTSTGKFNFPYVADDNCIGNQVTVIPPSQTVNSCIEFLIPNNALADTYYYDTLKWYL